MLFSEDDSIVFNTAKKDTKAESKKTETPKKDNPTLLFGESSLFDTSKKQDPLFGTTPASDLLFDQPKKEVKKQENFASKDSLFGESDLIFGSIAPTKKEESKKEDTTKKEENKKEDAPKKEEIKKEEPKKLDSLFGESDPLFGSIAPTKKEEPKKEDTTKKEEPKKEDAPKKEENKKVDTKKGKY